MNDWVAVAVVTFVHVGVNVVHAGLRRLMASATELPQEAFILLPAVTALMVIVFTSLDYLVGWSTLYGTKCVGASPMQTRIVLNGYVVLY